MVGLGKGVEEEHAETTTPSSHVRGTSWREDRSVIREATVPRASKLTVPSRRSAELAHVEQLLAIGEGHQTAVMETMSLVEAEREIAKTAQEGAQSGVRELAAEPAVQAAPSAPFVHAGQEPSNAAAPLAQPPNEVLIRARGRRRTALWIVGAVIGAAVALIAVSMARRGWSMAVGARAPSAQSQR